MKIREITLGDKILVSENGINPKMMEVTRVTPTLAILEDGDTEYRLLRNLPKPSQIGNGGDFQAYGLEVDQLVTFYRHDPNLSEIERKNKILEWVFKYLNRIYSNRKYGNGYEFNCVEPAEDFYMLHFKSKIDGSESSIYLGIEGEIAKLVHTYNDHETLINYIHTLAPLMLSNDTVIA